MNSKQLKTILTGCISGLIILIVTLLITSTSSAASVSPFEGNWIGTHRDGSELSLAIGGRPSGPFTITLTDENMAFCGGPGINQGTGMLNPQDPNLVEANMSLLCVKRSETYDNYLTAVYNPIQDTLLVNSGISFHRANFNPQECVAAPNGLSGWWPGDGNANDLTSGNNGEFKGDATTVKGLVDQAFKLDGDGDYIEVPDNPVLNFGTNEFTIDLWVNFENLNGQQILVEKWIQGYSISQGWTLNKYDKSLYLTWANGEGQEDSIGVDIPGIRPHVWYHFAVARNDQFVSVYLNGTVIGSKTYDTPLNLNSSTPLLFGRTGDDRGFYLDGLIDEVELYNGTALTQEQIFGLYLAGAAGKCKADFLPIPSIRAHPVWDSVDAWFWPEDKIIHLSIDDPNTQKNPDVYMVKRGDDKFAGTVWFELAPYDLKSGDIVTMTDGLYSKTIIVSNLTITGVNLAQNFVEGYATENGTVRLPYTDAGISVPVLGSGYWSFDFDDIGIAIPTGAWLIAEEFENDADLTSFEYWVP